MHVNKLRALLQNWLNMENSFHFFGKASYYIWKEMRRK